LAQRHSEQIADEAKLGTHWQDEELDLIVEDYFSMLEADVSGRPYVKSRHSAALMVLIGRTHRSVEFKHQNISAVLDELGMPWIPGYKPKRNYQNAIFGAIDRFLTSNPDVLDGPFAPSLNAPLTDVFVAAPSVSPAPAPAPEGLKRLIRKFDPVERDFRNRSLGKAGEQFVFDLERRRLAECSRSDLAGEVRWVAFEDGDGAGYDIRSFDQDGQERLLEVKTTNGSARTPFFLTRNERTIAAECADSWCIYRVHLFSRAPQIFVLSPPLEKSLHLSTEIWRASF